jgi:hypothetical protein
MDEISSSTFDVEHNNDQSSNTWTANMAVTDFASLLEPCDELDDAPTSWAPLSEDFRSISCEVEKVANAITTTPSGSLHWVYVFDATTIPEGTHGLACITVLLRGTESDGMRKYVHSIILGLRTDNETASLSQFLDMAECPPRESDSRVLDFPRFSLERPLLFGSSLSRLEIHVHLLEPPPWGQDMIKVVVDAVYAPRIQPYLESSPIFMPLARDDGGLERIHMSSDAALILDSFGQLRLNAAHDHPLATVVHAEAKLISEDKKMMQQKRTVWEMMAMEDINADDNRTILGIDSVIVEDKPFWVRELESRKSSLPDKYSSMLRGGGDNTYKVI